MIKRNWCIALSSSPSSHAGKECRDRMIWRPLLLRRLVGMRARWAVLFMSLGKPEKRKQWGLQSLLDPTWIIVATDLYDRAVEVSVVGEVSPCPVSWWRTWCPWESLTQHEVLTVVKGSPRHYLYSHLAMDEAVRDYINITSWNISFLGWLSEYYWEFLLWA